MIGVMADQHGRKPARLYVVNGRADLMALIRELAGDTSKVFLTDHAVARMFERGLSDGDVFKVLRMGEIVGSPWLEEDGCRACKVVLRQKGDRDIGVITILVNEDSELVVKTVEWEDWK